MITWLQNLTILEIFVYLSLLAILPIGIFAFFFRDLFFESAFKYEVKEYHTPQKGMVLSFLKFPKHSAKENFSLLKWWDDRCFKDKIVIVAGEAAPRIYDKDFYDKVYLAKDAGVKIKMLAGPVFLKNTQGQSFVINAAKNDLIDLFVVNRRANRHFRANLYTGELYYEFPHEPNEPNRTSVHFKENKFEVKQYLRSAKKLEKKSKPFKNCEINKDYLLVTKEDLDIIKKCIEINGIKDFNECTASEILEVYKDKCLTT